MESFSTENNSTDPLSEPLDKPQVILSMVILSLTFVLGLPGNGLVLWVTGLKMQRTVNTVWFLHLTLADFLCCLSLPFSLAHLALQGFWPYGPFFCKLIPSVIVLNMFASVFLLTAISLDRCLLVLKPVWCQNHRSVRTAFAVCGCIWLVAFVMCVPVFMYREMSVEGDYYVCDYNYGPSSSYYEDFTSDLDLLENGSLDYSVEQLPGEMDNSLIILRMRQGRFAKSRNKTSRVAMVVVAVFLVCWAPYHIFGVLLLLIDPGTPVGKALASWDNVSLALASANSCINPFLYAFLGKDFRKKVRQSIQGLLEAAFSEELTHSSSCPPNKVFSERNSISTAV
ncbi:C3a anaphylatoxin chemotactic receptor [Tupaia chinensis]|uniref:C3a anaphylatoxin chemotactic receptor n=1 Tax=Tupaia chinensis TaxID=246437 RepID=L9KXG0_TUPCH|nr:C3a anaphylatoxin chemotactic receptor [Tupaia chinensis]